jgi:valyl-tRNA synthetase
MVMMGIEFTGQIPFSDVYVHSIIQAPDGRRMSKSLGTGIDPLDLISGGPRPPVFAEAPDGSGPAHHPNGDFPAYGADAVRWGLLAMSSGQDVRFNEEKVSQAQQLTNKLWNASRLILLRVDSEVRASAQPVSVEDRWILSRLQYAATLIGDAIGQFEFSRAALSLYEFIFSELCDWYLELVKPRLYEDDKETQAFLLHVLTETVTLAHPLIPFVTEEIYAHIPGASGLLAERVAPRQIAQLDEAAIIEIDDLIAAVQSVRAWRDAAEVKPSAVLDARVVSDVYAGTADQLYRLGRLNPKEMNGTGARASIPVAGGSIEIFATEGLDLDAAARKKAAKRAELEREIERAEGKLSNSGFVDKAPPAVVEAERAKLTALRAELEAL